MNKYDVTDFLIRSNARMKNLRSEYGYSYKKLAELTGISSSTLQRYENNPFASIPLSKIKSIAKAYNVSPGYLMGWESRYLSNEDLEGFSKLLDDIGYDLNYDEITESFKNRSTIFPKIQIIRHNRIPKEGQRKSQQIKKERARKLTHSSLLLQ